MKIGDEVYIHGYIDEIRNDVIIIKNQGGYFGTIKEEIFNKPLDIMYYPQVDGITPSVI